MARFLRRQPPRPHLARPVTAMASMTAVPLSVLASIVGNVLTVTGVATGWTPGTPGLPSFTVSAGTVTAQVVDTSTSARLTYTSPTAQSVTVTDPNSGASTTVGIVASSGGTIGSNFRGGFAN
jgi:hypothetical protein